MHAQCRGGEERGDSGPYYATVLRIARALDPSPGLVTPHSLGESEEFRSGFERLTPRARRAGSPA